MIKIYLRCILFFEGTEANEHYRLRFFTFFVKDKIILLSNTMKCKECKQSMDYALQLIIINIDIEKESICGPHDIYY